MPLCVRELSGVLAVALASAGCLAPALSPVHPMTALASPSGQKEVETTLGYAPAPGGGLGDSVIPGTPYSDGELRWQVSERVQLQGGLGIAFQRYFLPWPSSVGLGSRITLDDDPQLAFAIAPRVVAASAFNVVASKDNTIFGTRELGGELPVIATHRFENGMALSLEGWGRYYALRQEDAVADKTNSSGSTSGAVSVPRSSGYTWTAGGALLFSFPKVRHSPASYHAFLGAERLWLTQTGATGDAPGSLSPLIHLGRWSLTVGLGTTTPW